MFNELKPLASPPPGTKTARSPQGTKRLGFNRLQKAPKRPEKAPKGTKKGPGGCRRPQKATKTRQKGTEAFKKPQEATKKVPGGTGPTKKMAWGRRLFGGSRCLFCLFSAFRGA